MLFVSSNQSYRRMLESSLVIDEQNIPRYDRRAKELFNMLPLQTCSPMEISPTKYEHAQELHHRLQQLVTKHHRLLTRAVQTELLRHFPGLLFELDERSQLVKINPQHLTPVELSNLLIDLEFYGSTWDCSGKHLLPPGQFHSKERNTTIHAEKG